MEPAVESDFATFLFQLVREGGSAAGGALFIGAGMLWLVLTGRLVTRAQYLDKERQLQAALRELRRTNRTMQAGITTAARAVRTPPDDK